jgi:hypothetical protein
VKNLLNHPFDPARPPEREHFIDADAQNVEDCFQSVLKTARMKMNGLAV